VRALLLANADDADPGFVGHHLHRRGYAFAECLREAPGEWPSLDGVELLLHLGSEWSVYWPHVAGAVAAEAELLRTAHLRDIPILAICFGSQLAAHALGGTVHRMAAPEIGWWAIDSDVDEIAGGPWMQWHSDAVTMPPGAVELARNPFGVQTWRRGRLLCTQFHPEATETMLARWTAGGSDELALVGSSGEALMTTTRANVKQARLDAERLVDWFLDHVAG